MPNKNRKKKEPPDDREIAQTKQLTKEEWLEQGKNLSYFVLLITLKFPLKSTTFRIPFSDLIRLYLRITNAFSCSKFQEL